MQTASDFLREFDAASRSADGERSAALFSDSFMAAGADGVRVLTPSDLVKAIAMRRGMLEKSGVGPAAFVGFEERDLDAHYVMVTGTWQWDVRSPQSAPVSIALASTFILRRTPAGLRIVFYRSGDIMGELRARGLLAT